ncbi:MAG: hypothetical protein E7599_00265 [Ruminococcaceae bacterium]|nr:hypothetical protein [Oscillospiraceae bacterium]
MRKRILSFVLTLLMVLACVPATALTATAEDTTPTIYVMEDVYGKPGETVAVKVGFKNTNGKNIQQFQATISAGEAAINQTTAISATPMPEGGGAGVVNDNGSFSFACGVGSFTPETYFTIKVTIPEDAKDGDVYDLSLSVSADFSEVLRWEDGTSASGNVSFEGAKLYVTRYDPVTVSVADTVAYVGDKTIRVPVMISASNGKLASCTQLSFSISGTAADKVEIDPYASKEFAIKGNNESYVTVLPVARSFSLGFAGGFENAVAPTDDFRIFELVFTVVTPLDDDDTFVVTPFGSDPFKAYGEDATETVPLFVKEYVAGTVSTVLPYEWAVLDEEAATAELILYTGSASEVTIPSTIRGDGTIGTDGKEYTVVSLYGEEKKVGKRYEYYGVFYENSTVTDIRIPESVKTVHELAISECVNLKTLTVMSPDLEITEDYGETFLYCFVEDTEEYVLPEGLVIKSYESATIKTWADDNEATFDNLIKLVGEQKGDNGIRFIGGVSDLEYKNVDFSVHVVETDKTYSKAATSVYKTFRGAVNGTMKPVVTTVGSVSEETGAHLIEDFSYLFGYAITGVPTEGRFTFEVTPTAVTGGGVTVYGKTVTVVYENGNIINN